MNILTRHGLSNKTFSQRMRIPQQYTGGFRHVNVSAETITELRNRALVIIDRRIAKFKTTNNVDFIEPAYLDGIEVYKGRAYLRLIVVGQVLTKLALVRGTP